MSRRHNVKEGACWYNMKQRCYNPKNSRYEHYGGRGIKVCDRWINSFDNFFEDMGKQPDGMTIDRINNDGDYEPSNCQWATRSQQSLNQRVRKDNSSGIKGVHAKGSRWVAKYKGQYLGTFINLNEAINIRRRAEYGTVIE